jgi:rhamnosyltransferase
MVAAIIVTFNPDIELLLKQQESLKSQVDVIVYVDNNSSNIEEFIDLIKENQVILSKSNLGLGKAQNLGIDFCIKHGADFILFLDQDSVLVPNMVEELVNEYKSLVQRGKSVATMCPVIISDFNNEKCKAPTRLGCRIKIKEILETQEVAFCISSGSLVPVPIIKKVGGIQEDFFIDALDVEWCLRAKSKGYGTFMTPRTHLIHQLGNSNKDKILNHNEKREFYIVRNGVALSRLSYVPFGYRVRRLLMAFNRVLYSFFHGYWGYFKSGLKGLFAGFSVSVNSYYVFK